MKTNKFLSKTLKSTVIAVLTFSHLATAANTNSNSASESSRVVRTEFIILNPSKIVIDLDPDITAGIYRQYTADKKVIFSYCTANSQKLHLDEELSETTIPELELIKCYPVGRKQGYSKVVLDAINREFTQKNLGFIAGKTGGVILAQVVGTAAGYLVGRQLKMQNPWMLAGITQLVGIASAFYLQDYSTSYLARQALIGGSKKITINETLIVRLSSTEPSYSELVKGIAYLDSVYEKYEDQLMK